MSDAPEKPGAGGSSDPSPLDSFAGRLKKAQKPKGMGKSPAPPPPSDAPPASPPAPPPPQSPPGMDSFSGRLGKALKKNKDAAPTEPSPAPVPEPSPFDSFTGRLDKASKEAESAKSADGSSPQPPPDSTAPLGAGEHTVRQGECILSIARQAGHFWETLWNDATNRELRDQRKDPHVLLPGDRVHVPQLREKWQAGATEMRHRFRRRGDPAMLRLTLRIDDVPLANEAFTLDVDGRAATGSTDAEGKIAVPIAPGARSARLVVGAERWVFNLQLGCIDPIESVVGVQQRLINLGFDCGRTDGQWDDRCRQAISDFQKASGLTQNGTPDDLTRDKLKQSHGS